MVKAPATEAAAATISPSWQPNTSDPTPAPIATPASCATRLDALLILDARPWSDGSTLDMTEAVRGATNNGFGK